MPTSAPNRALTGYQAATESVRARVLSYVKAVWANSPSFRDADIDRIVARIIPVVQAGQVQVAQLTDAYVGRMSVLAGVTWVSGVDREAVVDYRGVPADDVYRRPAVTTYTALSKGASYADAVTQGANRLQSIVATDIQQAKNRQASRSIGGSGFKYFERRLTGRENCAFCVIASTQRYLNGDLMPLHPGCDCDCVPLQSMKDPGQVIKPELLELTHAAIDAKLGGTDRGARELGLNKSSTKGQPLSDFTELIIVNEHGELGPTLGWRSDHFTGPGDLPMALN